MPVKNPTTDILAPTQREINHVARLKLILKLILGIMILGLINDVVIFDRSVLAPTLIFIIAVIGLLYTFVTTDTVSMVAGIFIWMLTIAIFYVCWNTLGLFASAMAALPAVVVLAITLTRRAVYLPLFCFIIVGLGFFSYCYDVGLLTPPVVADNYSFMGKAADIFIIVLMAFLMMEFLIRGVRADADRMALENLALLEKLQDVKKLTDFDTLTGLPNERLCAEDLSRRISQSKAEGRLVGFLVLKVHNLRAINNSVGHEIANQLLQELSERLRALVSKTTDFYRLQGHEFIAIKETLDHQELVSFAEQLLQAANLPFLVEGHELEVGLSIGISVAPFDGNSLETLRKKCHLALQFRQKNDALAYNFFDADMVNESEQRFKLLSELKAAINNEEFELYFQPKVDLNSGQVVGAEALIRWHRPGHGMVPPNVFIGLAEESGLILDISQWVARTAINACKQWHEHGLQHISVAINLSEIDFRRGNLPQKLIGYLNQAQLSPHYLEIELTESMIIDDVSHAQKQIQLLHNKGVSLAIDDFGTGYSNLGYLSKFNVSSLKIDQSFIRKITESEHDFHIVKAIIQMGKSLGISIVAEGIEDKATERKLKKLECQFGQGYLWSKPLSHDDFIEYLKEHAMARH